MVSANVLMLTGASGHAFFLREMLLTQGVARQVDLVRDMDEAMAQVKSDHSYDLVIVGLDDSWEEGLQLGYWCQRQALDCPVLILTPPDVTHSAPSESTILFKEFPQSLREFVQEVREVLGGRRSGNATSRPSLQTS
jgi:DNA-binding NtrC family response regulator